MCCAEQNNKELVRILNKDRTIKRRQKKAKQKTKCVRIVNRYNSLILESRVIVPRHTQLQSGVRVPCAVCAKCRMCGIANGVNCQKCRRSNGWMRNRHSQRNMRANLIIHSPKYPLFLFFLFFFFDLISLYSFCCVGRFFGSHIIHKVHSAFNSSRLVDNNYLPRHILSPLCPVCVFSSVFSHSIFGRRCMRCPTWNMIQFSAQ